LAFVEPVQNATRFFTFMTTAMLVTAVVVIVGEAGSDYVWVPIVFLAGVIAATALSSACEAIVARTSGASRARWGEPCMILIYREARCSTSGGGRSPARQWLQEGARLQAIPTIERRTHEPRPKRAFSRSRTGHRP